MALQQKFQYVCQYIRYQYQVSSQLLPGRQQRTVKKKENKLACQNINKKTRDSAKQGELVVKETVQDHKMEIIL